MPEIDRRTNERRAFQLLYAGFVAAPLIAGFDKFTDTKDRPGELERAA